MTFYQYYKNVSLNLPKTLLSVVGGIGWSIEKKSIDFHQELN